ncbi:MAG: agmatinase family protein [Leptolyngbya sp. SIO4C1]|nr:agmatinase family protein [Leptolyngbya sp. SIO4C1]
MVTKLDIIASFDPSEVGLENGNLFGFPFTYETADIIVLGVPWEVSVSYGAGTAQGPQAILEASPQLDFYDLDNPTGWQQGIFMLPIASELISQNAALRAKAAQIIAGQEQGVQIAADDALASALAEVNRGCDRMNQWVFQQSQQALRQQKKVAVIGGDHSVPLGYLQALGEQYAEFGVLHIDAHADLRRAYEGFEFSHASIMYNALQMPQIVKLAQVGLRDVSPAEVQLAEASDGRAVMHFDAVLKQQRYGGTPWLTLCQKIVADLPQQVYISFDVDGLDPKLCPRTGTPVPGGLEIEEAYCLCREVVRSGREIVGFDLCEVGPDSWDGNVGARIVYKLCNLMGLSGRA